MSKILIICVSVLILSVSAFAQSEVKPCPAIEIVEPASLTDSGSTMTFSVNVEMEKVTSKLKYEWSVSAGTIVEGQETSTIRIATTPEMGGSTVIAKVTIQGLPFNCSNETSGNAMIAETIACGLLDDYGTVSSAMAKSMLDSIFVQLFNNPEHIAFFRLGREKGETIKQTKSRIKRIIKHANYRKLDKNLLVFAVDKSETNSFGYSTSAYLVPKNNKLPECENCEIIKGEDVK